MKKLTIFFLVSLLLELVLVAKAAEIILTPAYPKTVTTGNVILENTFTRTLTVGSSGRDIMALKKIISLELGTSVESGSTFTATTKNNVKKLQEKYAVETLIPVGLSAGTGYVGLSTIKKLNQLASKYNVKLSNFTVSTARTTFITTLQIGSIGDEVALLKTILNSSTSTALNPKNSTNIFDTATVVAVKKFQEKYASEILAPSGLRAGTGVVGPSTRKKLNSLLNSILESIKNTDTQTINNNSL